MNKQVFTLPFPPSSNRTIRLYRGKVIQARCSKDYENLVSLIVSTAKFKPYRHPQRLQIEIELCFPTAAKTDIDNRIRAIFNALEVSGVVECDQMFDVMLVERGEKVKGGKAIVKISVL